MAYEQATKDYAQAQENKVALLNILRPHEESSSRDRDHLQRDYARILYSASFRRLQGKMQLLGVNQRHFFRNRLTHSLEVAQIARSIAADLGLNEPIVAEACSLAHDLGNPPFGHHGERVLNDLASGIGGFEGNAQTFRILFRLEKRHYAYGGLNLTLRTLLGVVKYFFKRSSVSQKKFLYDDDFELVSEILEKYGLGEKPNTIDKQVMDKADEIAYGAHDLEDCLSLGLFTIDEILYEFSYKKEYEDAYKTLQQIVEKCREFAGNARRLETSEEFSFLFRKELTSSIVHALASDIYYSPDENMLSFRENASLAKWLKELTFKAALRRPDVQLYEKKGAAILRGLYDVYTDEKFNKDLMLLPPEFRCKQCSDAERKRNVVDYIAGMMDGFAEQEYLRYFGSGSLERLYLDNYA
jgi:dGTPase